MIRFAFALLLLACNAAQAQTFPSRPVRMVVTFTAGGTPDAIARIVAHASAVAGLGSTPNAVAAARSASKPAWP